MASIILVTHGSRGDVQPLLALTLALKSSGHDVLLCAPPENADWAASLGCPFYGLGSNFRALMGRFPDPHTLSAAAGLARHLRLEFQYQLAQLPAVIKGADLVLGASLTFTASTVAELFGVSYRFIAFCPQILPSGRHPCLLFRNHDLPRWLNRLSWWLMTKLDIFKFVAVINEERRRLGLRRMRDGWRSVLGERVMVASDPVLGPIPRDAGQDHIQTGYIHLHQKGTLGEDLERFLACGPPPVYVGFGSMPSANPVRTTRLVIESARAAGQRLVVSRGWAKMGDMALRGDCHVVEEVPHMLLFPRMSAVVHHGGSGTTATAALAGVPQIIVPHVLDQYYWGSQIQRLGLGPKPIYRSRLTAERLAEAIREGVSNEAMRSRAREIALTLQGQDSLREAVNVIESEFLPR